MPQLGRLAVSATAAIEKGPYVGALDRLIQVHRGAALSSLRSLALTAMLGVAGRSRALAYLREVAASSDSTSLTAVNALIIDANGGSLGGLKPSSTERGESRNILRELFQQHLVTNSQAKALLEAWAAHAVR